MKRVVLEFGNIQRFPSFFVSSAGYLMILAKHIFGNSAEVPKYKISANSMTCVTTLFRLILCRNKTKLLCFVLLAFQTFEYNRTPVNSILLMIWNSGDTDRFPSISAKHFTNSFNSASLSCSEKLLPNWIHCGRISFLIRLINWRKYINWINQPKLIILPFGFKEIPVIIFFGLKLPIQNKYMRKQNW